MKISVQLHGKHRVIAGTEKLTFDIEETAVVSDIISRITRLHPEIDFQENSTLIVLNDYAVQKDTHIKENDIISFVPVFGGG